MRLLTTLLFTSAASASALLSAGQLQSLHALKGVIEKRVICIPVTAPVTCARSCGPGYVQCISFPNCYNPSIGQSCCSDGKYCDPGTYCTDAGCCPDGTSLADCGATISLSVIPPPAATSTTPPSSSTAAPITTSTSTTEEPTTTSTSTSEEPTTTSTTSETTTAAPTTAAPTTTAQSNGTVTTPPVQFTGAAMKLGFNVPVALGGLGVALMVL